MWQISSPGTGLQTFASLGLSNLVRTSRSQAVSTMTFVAMGAALDSDPLWDFKTLCTIYKDGARFFVGSLTKPQSAGSGSSESVEYELSCPWWWLERIVFQQTWVGRGLYPRVILGMDALTLYTGGRLTCGAQITEILNYAISCGAPLQIGSIATGPTPPFTERVSMTCAEAIKMMLRWMPDCVAWWDYTTAPYPTLNITPRADSPSVTFSLGVPPLDAVPHIIPRYDLLVPEVVLYFESKDTADGAAYTHITTDAVPMGSTGQADGSIIQCLELAGSTATFARNVVKTAPIPWGVTSGDTAVAWYMKHDPKLSGLSHTAVDIIAGSTSAVIPPSQTDPNGNTISTDFTVPYAHTDLPRELLPGSQITSWMVKPASTSGTPGTTTPTDGYQHAVAVNFTVSLTYDYTTAGITDVEKDRAEQIFGPKNQYDLTFSVIATNALSQTYTKMVSYTGGEAVPTGIAASLYSALSVLHYQGEIALVEQECSQAAGLNHVLNLAGGRSEWATMNAQIQAVTEQIDHGTTRLTIGPPEHLSHADMVELLRASRTANTSARTGERAGGPAGTATTVDHTSVTGQTNTVSGGGSGVNADFPWKFIQGTGSDATKSQMNQYSYLFKVGLDGSTESIGTDFSSWLDDTKIYSGGYAWLEIAILDTGAVDQVDMHVGSGWTGMPKFYHIDSGGATPYVDYWYVPLAKFIDPTSTDPAPDYTIKVGGTTVGVVQLCDQHLAEVYRAVGGLVALSVEAWQGV